MKNLKPSFTIVPLFIVLMLFYTPLYATEPTESDKSEVAQVIYQTIYQIKTIIVRRLAANDIEELIKRARDLGATGYKLNKYSGGKMGWSIEDSKGREVYSVIFSFHEQQAREGVYLTPLMTFRDAKEVHSWHRKVISSYFRQIDADKYDINDNCLAFVELFKGATGLGRTRINIKCH
jgi:hypothetical protein